MSNKLQTLAAAFDVSIGYQFCPDEHEADNAFKTAFTQFSLEETREGFKICHGMRRSQIANMIIEEIDSLKDAQELLKTYNRWRRGEEIEQPDPIEIGKAIDKLTL